MRGPAIFRRPGRLRRRRPRPPRRLGDGRECIIFRIDGAPRDTPSFLYNPDLSFFFPFLRHSIGDQQLPSADAAGQPRAAGVREFLRVGPRSENISGRERQKETKDSMISEPLGEFSAFCEPSDRPKRRPTVAANEPQRPTCLPTRPTKTRLAFREARSASPPLLSCSRLPAVGRHFLREQEIPVTETNQEYLIWLQLAHGELRARRVLPVLLHNVTV